MPPSTERFIPVHVPTITLSDTVTNAIFLGSTAWYLNRYFRHDRSFLKLGVFLTLNSFAAKGYAKALFQPAISDAILINNAQELVHHNKIGKRMPVS
eukprot:403341296